MFESNPGNCPLDADDPPLSSGTNLVRIPTVTHTGLCPSCSEYSLGDDLKIPGLGTATHVALLLFMDE